MNAATRNLNQEIVEQLTPVGVHRELLPWIPSLREPQNGKVEVRAICSFHDDHAPSWCWNLEKGIAVCHVCGEGNVSFLGYISKCTGRKWIKVAEDYCKTLGLPSCRKRTLTLSDYAQAKCLPVEFLRTSFSLSDGPDGLEIPYLGIAGDLIAERGRRYITAKPKWKKQGTPARNMIYGLHGLPWIGPTGYVFVVEGESDLHTAWYYDLPALAMPGASVGHRAVAETIARVKARTVFVLPDDDAGGQLMVTKLNAGLKLSGWTGDLRVAQLPAKDLSTLHVEHGECCERSIGASLHSARPAEAVIEGYRQQGQIEDRNVIRLVRKVSELSGVNATDRVILNGMIFQIGGLSKRPLSMPKSRFAKSIKIPRRTFFARLPGLIEKGLLEDDGHSLFLGKTLLR